MHLNAKIMKDDSLLSKLEQRQSVAYHANCLASYVMKVKTTTSEYVPNSPWYEIRDKHKMALESICKIIDSEIIEKQKVMYLSDLFSRYKAVLLEQNKSKESCQGPKTYNSQKFETKLLNVFGEEIVINKSTGPYRRKIVYSRHLDVSALANEIASLENKHENRMRDTAYELRNCVRSLESNKLPNNLSVDDVIRGECDIPEKLFNFISDLIEGPDACEESSEDKIKIKSLCSDIIFMITKGKIKPSKHLTLGLAMKSLTSSRKVVTILNKFGHSISYHVAEELETAMTYTAHKANEIIPSGIVAVNGRSTHLAFDNYDRYVDTFNGKNTLHDTVGIIYQFARTDSDISYEPQRTESNTTQVNEIIDESCPRKRRKFDVIPRDLVPYFRKPSIEMKLLPVNTMLEYIDSCKENTEIAVNKDLIWAMSLSQIGEVPMWLGFNCQLTVDTSEVQKIDYLPPINASPTSYPVVNETLLFAQKVAEKCQQEQIIVTYDLQIAKMAMEIVEKERPKFDKIFVNLGAFHTQMALFRAIGKYIDGSGLVDVLVQSEVLASGSMNSFLDGKHFNRCKRLHPLTSISLQVLHFEEFLSTISFDPELLQQDLEYILNSTIGANEKIVPPANLQRVLDSYKNYCQTTLSGGHGKTARFYFQYTQFVNLFLRFSRSVRTSNFELYIETLFDMCDLFFALNQTNYARWSVKYLSNLIELAVNDSPLVSEFRRGAFGVKRTSNSLARLPVDLTLEQTINGDAANTLTGVSHFTNSISARQRWALSHSMRTKILTTVAQITGLSHGDDTVHVLQKNRLERDKKDLQKIIETLKNTINPFDKTIDHGLLFNLYSGRASASEVGDFLLGVPQMGREQKIQFIENCSEIPGTFEKPIKQNKIVNFASQCVKKIHKGTNGRKEILLKMERDVFGRLLAIALEKNVDLEHCLEFPLTIMPPALFDCSGTMFKTDKSALAKLLKSMVTLTTPPEVDVEIIDGFFSYIYSIICRKHLEKLPRPF